MKHKRNHHHSFASYLGQNVQVIDWDDGRPAGMSGFGEDLPEAEGAHHEIRKDKRKHEACKESQ